MCKSPFSFRSPRPVHFILISSHSLSRVAKEQGCAGEAMLPRRSWCWNGNRWRSMLWKDSEPSWTRWGFAWKGRHYSQWLWQSEKGDRKATQPFSNELAWMNQSGLISTAREELSSVSIHRIPCICFLLKCFPHSWIKGDCPPQFLKNYT